MVDLAPEFTGLLNAKGSDASTLVTNFQQGPYITRGLQSWVRLEEEGICVHNMGMPQKPLEPGRLVSLPTQPACLSRAEALRPAFLSYMYDRWFQTLPVPQMTNIEYFVT